MTTIFERTATALSGLGVDCANGFYITATGVDLPDTFIVFVLVSSPPVQHADDGETLRSNRVQVSIYSRAGLVGLPDVELAMKAAGFEAGAKYQLPYNSQTRHFGLGQDFMYLEEK